MMAMSSNSFIPLSIPNLSGNELKYVTEAITDAWVSSVGPHVSKFEENFAKYIGTKYAVACVNGTAAIHISLLVAGVIANDEVIAPNLTFVAPINAIRYCNAYPILMDSNWENLGIDVNKLQGFLENNTYQKDGYTWNKNSNRRISAIVPMHTLGYPVDMDPLLKLAEKYNMVVIEDATESLGSEYKGKKTGNLGSIGCFSFNGNKIMTTGGGGMIVTNNVEIAEKAKHLTTTAKTDNIEYHHDQVGYNYRMVNVLAAIGLGQLEQMDTFVEIKRKNHSIYKEAIDKIPGFSLHVEQDFVKSNYWMYSLVLDSNCKYTVRQLVDVFAKEKIQTRPIWKLMSDLPMFQDVETFTNDVSKDIYKRVLSIPCSTNIKHEEIVRVIDVIKNL